MVSPNNSRSCDLPPLITSACDVYIRQINFEMCCHAQLLADSALRKGESLISAGPEEIASTKAEIGSAEMGWFCLKAYEEEEEWFSKGDHKL